MGQEVSCLLHAQVGQIVNKVDARLFLEQFREVIGRDSDAAGRIIELNVFLEVFLHPFPCLINDAGFRIPLDYDTSGEVGHACAERFPQSFFIRGIDNGTDIVRFIDFFAVHGTDVAYRQQIQLQQIHLRLCQVFGLMRQPRGIGAGFLQRFGFNSAGDGIQHNLLHRFPLTVRMIHRRIEIFNLRHTAASVPDGVQCLFIRPAAFAPWMNGADADAETRLKRIFQRMVQRPRLLNQTDTFFVGKAAFIRGQRTDDLRADEVADKGTETDAYLFTDTGNGIVNAYRIIHAFRCLIRFIPGTDAQHQDQAVFFRNVQQPAVLIQITALVFLIDQ